MLSPSPAQMIVAGYDSGRHDRFVEDRNGMNFLGDELNLDLSGVGRVNARLGRWVTMISPRHFLTSTHAKADSGTVTFYLGNELTSPTVECAVDPEKGRRIGETDVWLGALVEDSCDTSLLSYYPLAQPDRYVGRDVVAVGRSSHAPAAKTTDMRIGRNKVSYAKTGEFFRGTGDHIVFVDDSADGDLSGGEMTTGPALVDGEFRVANGDSGGPTLVRSETGEYEVLGIHTYLGYDGRPGLEHFRAQRWASIDAYVPTERNAIYEQIKLEDPEFTFKRDQNSDPVGDAVGRDFFPIESGFDCDLNNVVDAQDLNCTTWIGSLTTLEFTLEDLGIPLGDINMDGRVGFEEFLKVTSNFNKKGRYTDGDFTLDGFIDFSDFLILTRNFGVDLSQEPAAAAVPEPRVHAALILLIVTTARRRRRNVR